MRSLFSLFMLISSLITSGAPTAQEIVKRADDKLRGESSYSEMTMTIVRPSYQRSISMKTWSKGSDFALIKITAPAKEKGQSYVKRQKEMWNWIPAIDKMVKMSSSMMGQSWMGSDFTNDDMVRESSMVRDYSPVINGSETLREFNCYRIELTPHEDAAVVWGKVIVWIDKENYHIIKSESYDEEMILAQTMENFDFKLFGDRIMPARMVMTPAEKKGQKTIVTVTKANYNIPIAESFFSQQNLKKLQ